MASAWCVRPCRAWTEASYPPCVELGHALLVERPHTFSKRSKRLESTDFVVDAATVFADELLSSMLDDGHDEHVEE